MAENIDTILDKISNENFEINYRAMQNLLNKLYCRLITLDSIPENKMLKFLISLVKWFTYYLTNRGQPQYPYNESLITKVLDLFNIAIQKFPPNIVLNLKAQIKVSNLIADIGKVSQEQQAICDTVLQNLSKITLNSMEGNPPYPNAGDVQAMSSAGNFNPSNTFNPSSNTFNPSNLFAIVNTELFTTVESPSQYFPG